MWLKGLCASVIALPTLGVVAECIVAGPAGGCWLPQNGQQHRSPLPALAGVKGRTSGSSKRPPWQQKPAARIVAAVQELVLLPAGDLWNAQ